jgi:choline dehydrogenase
MERPRSIDLLVCGGGTAGAALAGIVARDTRLNVVLLEAGPDYGPLAARRWPADLLDARRIPDTHGWGYAGLAHPSHHRPTPFDRARVIGGCSSHNGCVALLGHRRDYDRWAELGNSGWGWEAVAPAFERAMQGLRVRTVADEEVTPFHQAFIDGALAAGIPHARDMNDPDETAGGGASPVNISDGIRWNSALGYLDPVRQHNTLTVIGDALVDRVEVQGGQAVAVHAIIDGHRERIAAGRIVLAAGAYGSPAILLRSGIGPADDLRTLGIDVHHELAGVGRALADHPAVALRYQPSAALEQELHAFEQAHWTPEEQALLKARSKQCTEAFDLHLYSVAGREADQTTRYYSVTVSSVAPVSHGRLRLASADPTAAPLIDHGYLSDPSGTDLEVLLDGVRLAREVMAEPLADGRLAAELVPGPEAGSRAELARFIERSVGMYYHPACSCRMGPADDPLAVVDAAGAVHGIAGLYVCDASIFPTLMRANTNLPAAMAAEHLAAVIGN